MLTRKQHDLLTFIHDRLQATGVSPSFEEMKEALNLRSKSGVHRLVNALEERRFIRRLPNRARALEVVRMPDAATPQRVPTAPGSGSATGPGEAALASTSSTGGRLSGTMPGALSGTMAQGGRKSAAPSAANRRHLRADTGAAIAGGSAGDRVRDAAAPSAAGARAGTAAGAGMVSSAGTNMVGNVVQGDFGRNRTAPPREVVDIPLFGRIAAGRPIEALEGDATLSVPAALLGPGEHYALEIVGDSMVEAGILEGDYALVRRCDTASDGDIVVALVDDSEATLKFFRHEGKMVRLEPANAAYPSQRYPASRVRIQGRLAGLLRRYG